MDTVTTVALMSYAGSNPAPPQPSLKEIGEMPIDISELIISLERMVAHTNQKEAAKTLGISPQYLNDILRYRREPGLKVLSALGLRKIVLYTDDN